jgi:S-adenosylmethionine:tRNA ribosyltransferase-isomerase
VSALAFELPGRREATSPPEARGTRRDGVRLMVAERAGSRITHARFDHLPEYLRPGDLVLVNVSKTLPAAVPATREDGRPVRVHFATRAPSLGERWRVIELRSPGGDHPERGQTGETLDLGHGASLTLEAPYAAGARLHLARFSGPRTVQDQLSRYGAPIRYGYVEKPWPLSAYQNVYATTPGSAEMPSAGRPLTAAVITCLVARGVLVAPLVLHTGVSSPERHEPPFPEQYEVPATTARLVNATREAGGRAIAVGTTAVRALETVARSDGTVSAGSGWTSLVIDASRGVRAVDGLITGWHEPEASHLQMLEAVAGAELLERSYDAALSGDYLWHEFGDSHLILA